MLRQRWRRAGFEHLSRVDLWNFSFFFFCKGKRKGKIRWRRQGASNFFSEIDLWNFFSLSLFSFHWAMRKN